MVSAGTHAAHCPGIKSALHTKCLPSRVVFARCVTWRCAPSESEEIPTWVLSVCPDGPLDKTSCMHAHIPICNTKQRSLNFIIVRILTSRLSCYLEVNIKIIALAFHIQLTPLPQTGLPLFFRDHHPEQRPLLRAAGATHSHLILPTPMCTLAPMISPRHVCAKADSEWGMKKWLNAIRECASAPWLEPCTQVHPRSDHRFTRIHTCPKPCQCITMLTTL